MSFQDRIYQIVKETMPSEAAITLTSRNDEFYFSVYWKLNDDSDRPNKISKIIVICVTHEAVDSFKGLKVGTDQEVAYSRVANYLSKMLAAFDPRHNSPKYPPGPPEERWCITDMLIEGH